MDVDKNIDINDVSILVVILIMVAIQSTCIVFPLLSVTTIAQDKTTNPTSYICSPVQSVAKIKEDFMSGNMKPGVFYHPFVAR